MSSPWWIQVESLDAEIESMAGPKKKAKPQPKLVHLEEATSRHKQHITRLEQVGSVLSALPGLFTIALEVRLDFQ